MLLYKKLLLMTFGTTLVYVLVCIQICLLFIMKSFHELNCLKVHQFVLLESVRMTMMFVITKLCVRSEEAISSYSMADPLIRKIHSLVSSVSGDMSE